MQLLQCDTIHDVDRVYNVTQRLGHLPALRVTDERMAVYLLERNFAGEVERQEDHPGDPEEENIPPSL